MNGRTEPAAVGPSTRLRTLGGLVLEGSAFARHKPLLLLAYLSLEGPKDRRHVAELFWPDASEPMTSLRVALAQLRRAAAGALEADGRRLVARAEADAAELLRQLDEGDLESVAGGYGGAFLEGFHLRDIGAELEEWVVGTREYLAEKVREAHLRLAEADAAAGHYAGAAARAERALRVAGAAEPTPEALERLYALLVAGDSLRANDIRQAASDYGIALRLTTEDARARFARGRGTAERPVPHNLLSRPGSFVGREPERLELARILGEPAGRIVTLTGQAGAGKSRLALEVALSELRSGRFADGVYFVALESIEDPGLVPAVIAAAMGVELAGREAPIEALVRVIGARRLLLLLDNFEQVSLGAPLVAELVAKCPELVVLVTSRDRLNVHGEQRLVVDGLAVPDPTLTFEDAPHQEAVQLFCARARGARLGFGLSREHLPHVVTICRLVGGLPLGIELAAAWVRLLPPAEIASEMARTLDFLDGGALDQPVRHRSLRAAFEHAWRMLVREEQGALGRLSVFSGGFTREAASRVAEVTIPTLASLADASLLRVVGDDRFDLHPLLHHFAREKLAAEPGARHSAYHAHAAYFAAFAERAEPALKGSQQRAWLDRLDVDHDNLRAALRRCVADGDANLGLRIAGALWQFWRVRGVAGEARAWYAQVLALPGADEPTRERAKALAGAGVLAFAHGAYDDAAALHGEALSLRRALEDRGGIAESLLYLGGMRAVAGALDEARHLFEESTTAFRALDYDWGVASALANLGRLRGMQGDLSSARAALEESLTIRLRAGDELGAAEARGRLGTLARREGDTARALTLWRDALATRHRLQARAVVPIALDAVAGLLAARGDVERAARVWGASERLRESIGAPLAPDVRQEYAGAVAAAHAVDQERIAAAWDAGRALGLDEAVAEALEVAGEENGASDASS